jgi:hypothetical protein
MGRTVSEFLDWLQQAVFEAETGRASATEIRARLLAEWGGVRVVVPKIDPQERLKVRALIEAGTAERTARMFVRGK